MAANGHLRVGPVFDRLEQQEGVPSLNLPDIENIKLDETSTSSTASGSSIDKLSHQKKPSVSRWQDQLTTVTHMLFYASTGDVDALEDLIASGADVNSADYDGRSALHLAASEGKLAAVNTLLARGAKVNPRDRWAHTPMSDAMQGVADGKQGEFQAIVKLLKEKGGIEEAQEGNFSDWEIDPAEIDLKKSRLIGKGAFGEIRRVTWRGTPVAVKTVLPSLINDQQIMKEFRDEVSLLLKLRHPNVVQFLGAVTAAMPLMLVTEYLPGGDLHEVIKERGGLPARVAVNYALDIARGMNYLHNHKPDAIIHRDLKPRNLLRDEGDHVKVADFGLSKLVKVTNLHDMYKMTGETGSYRYMAPEVFRHESYDCSVDVFSFAIIFYEMFEGLPPFAKTMTAEGVAWKTAMEAVRPPFKAKTYPPGTRELIVQCWAGVASQRPTFSKIIEKLEEIDRLMAVDRDTSSSSAQRHHSLFKSPAQNRH
eukprot:jgi/Mesen1/1788/ME000014S01189